jgi:serine/threonine protein kinase
MFSKLHATTDYGSLAHHSLGSVHSCNRIMHRDMKLQNLRINKDSFFKICDFGLARMFALQPREDTDDVVTLWYLSSC